MDSARIIINNQDLSTATELQQQTPVTGFTVVKAPKGPQTPVKISKGDTAKIQDIFGVASSEFPELYEAQLFNTGYDLYISAPYSEAKIPVAYITSKGIFASASPVEYNTEIEDYINGDDEASIEDLIYPSDGIELLLPMSHIHAATGASEAYENAEVSADADKITITLPAGFPVPSKEDDNSEGNADNPNPDNGDSGNEGTENEGTEGENPALFSVTEIPVTFTKFRLSNLPKGVSFEDIDIEANASYKDGVITFNTSNSLSLEDCNKIVVYAIYPLDVADSLEGDSLFTLHGAIFPKYPSSRKLNVSFAAFNSFGNYQGTTLADKNLLKINAYEEGAFHDKAHPVSFTGSIDSEARDGNGAFIGFSRINAAYNEQNLLGIHIRYPFNTASNPPNKLSYAPVVLEGGYKKFEAEPSYTTGMTDAEKQEAKQHAELKAYGVGWDFAKDEEYSVVDIFFDSRRQSRRLPGDAFFSLAEYHDLAGFIFNETLSSDVVNSETNVLNYGNRYWNICNEALVEFNSTGARFMSPLTGARALMQAKIIEQRWGGVAPMYLNSVGLGGQLSALSGSKFVKLKYKYKKDEQMKLDALNYNPVIRDNTYGVMVVGQKTCVSGAVSDWSYIGHVSAFLNFQREVKNNVMIPQLGKANNEYYRALRKQQVENILANRISGNNRIWAGAIVDTSTADGVNDVQARREKKFVINVMVKVDVFSEYVYLNFTNVDQDFAL